MATVGRHTKPNFTIAVNPDDNRIGVCYLKYYNSDNYRKATSVTGLNLRKPEKVFYKNCDGKREWILNSHDRKTLCDYLDELSSDFAALKITNWQVVLYHWNNEYGNLDLDFPENLYGSRIEAFIHGFYDTDENLKNPSYAESTLVRPDYTLS